MEVVVSIRPCFPVLDNCNNDTLYRKEGILSRRLLTPSKRNLILVTCTLKSKDATYQISICEIERKHRARSASMAISHTVQHVTHSCSPKRSCHATIYAATLNSTICDTFHVKSEINMTICSNLRCVHIIMPDNLRDKAKDLVISHVNAHGLQQPYKSRKSCSKWKRR